MQLSLEKQSSINKVPLTEEEAYPANPDPHMVGVS